MKSETVVVKDFMWRALLRKVWYATLDTVFVASENAFSRLESGENTPLPIGFPRSDVFRYEGKKPLRSINWAKMKRW